MTRPFSLTMQAYRLDLHPLWMVLLAASILMALAWIGWAATERLDVYETSTSVELTPQGMQAERDDASNWKENASEAEGPAPRWLEARFPADARERLKPGQSAVVFLKDKGRERRIPAVITEVSSGAPQEQVRVVLRADARKGAPDPFARALPSRVRVPTGAQTPLELWLPELAPRGETNAPERPQTPQ